MDEEIKKLLEKNLALTEETYRMTKKIKNYVNFQKVMSFFYLLLIVVPIILGVIYLPPILNGFYDQYKSILGLPASSSIQELLKGQTGGLLNGATGGLNLNNLDLKNIDINKLPPEFKALLNK